MDSNELRRELKRRPAVHKLFSGGFIQEILKLDENVLVVPLKELGFKTQAEYAANYVVDACGGRVEQEALDLLIEKGARALPTLSLVAFLGENKSAEELEKDAEPLLIGPEKILSWSTGDDLSLFAVVTANEENTFFRLIPQHSRRRQRLGFGNTGQDYANQLLRLMEAEKNDERFSFALSLMHDAVKEKNQQFKIARLFNCLECLAYKIKKKEGGKSRKAVKYMLGLEDGAMVEQVIQGIKYRYDRIEISGRLRDKLFHGVPFVEADLNEESQHVFELLESNPKVIADSLQADCELEIARWANGASKGQLEE